MNHGLLRDRDTAVQAPPARGPAQNDPVRGRVSARGTLQECATPDAGDSLCRPALLGRAVTRLDGRIFSDAALRDSGGPSLSGTTYPCTRPAVGSLPRSVVNDPTPRTICPDGGREMSRTSGRIIPGGGRPSFFRRVAAAPGCLSFFRRSITGILCLPSDPPRLFVHTHPWSIPQLSPLSRRF